MTRGVIAAVCCAAIFIIYGIVEKFLMKRHSSSRSGHMDVSTITSSYSKDNGVRLNGVGVDNLGLEKRE